MNIRRQVIELMRQIPRLPATTTRVITLLEDPESDLKVVSNAIQHDAGLAANVLRLANSSLFGGTGNVGSIHQAVARLGTKNLLPLLLFPDAAKLTQQSVVGYDLRGGALWEHCAAVAIGTTEFAAALDLRAPACTFTAGLLHDVGKVVLGTLVQSERELLMNLAFEEDFSFDAAEQQVLGIDHGEVGALLARDWGLPEVIVEVIRWHHQPARCPREHQVVVDLVHISDYACTIAGFGGGDDGTNYTPDSPTMDRLGVTGGLLEDTMLNIVSRLADLQDELAMPAEDCQSWE